MNTRSLLPDSVRAFTLALVVGGVDRARILAARLGVDARVVAVGAATLVLLGIGAIGAIGGTGGESRPSNLAPTSPTVPGSGDESGSAGGSQGPQGPQARARTSRG